MSEAFLKTQIISPDREIYSGNTEMVVLPGDDGDFAAMYEHAPLITYLRPGKLEVISEKKKEKINFFVSGGFVKIQNNSCIVMVDYIRKINDIDVKENENKISDLLIKAEQEKDQIIRDSLLIDIDLLRSENQASIEVK